MKVLRVTLLTGLLLVAVSPREIPTTTTSHARSVTTQVSAARSDGPCYLVNGYWYCEP